jgi:hypothetical protein
VVLAWECDKEYLVLMNWFNQILFRSWFRSASREVAMEKLLLADAILKRFLIVEVIGLIVILTAIAAALQQIP